MKIIRSFWGEQQHIWNEVPAFPLFEDEIVFVWGKNNEERLKSLGYTTYLMGEGVTEEEYSTIYDHFAHKLKVLVTAEQLYDEYLFLDWDVHIVKEIDDEFWNLIRSGNNVQCPIYGYPMNYEKKILEHIKNNPQKDWVQKLDPNTYPWISVQEELLAKYHWQWEDLQLVPNFCFLYSYKTDIATRLLDIYKEYSLKTCIEEYAMYIAANCTLQQFINTYEPTVIRGREDDCYHFDLVEDDTMRRINKFVAEQKPKKIYLKHI